MLAVPPVGLTRLLYRRSLCLGWPRFDIHESCCGKTSIIALRGTKHVRIVVFLLRGDDDASLVCVFVRLLFRAVSSGSVDGVH